MLVRANVAIFVPSFDRYVSNSVHVASKRFGKASGNIGVIASKLG